jgi:hypothetical protein
VPIVCAAGREQHQAVLAGLPPGFEFAPRCVPYDCHCIEIIHSGTAKGAIRGWKACRPDNVRFDAKTRT